MYWCILINWMFQSAVALYIYRAGGLVAQEILLQDLNLWKTLVVLGLYLDRSVPAGQATVPRPVRPLGQTGWCQFWLSTYAPLFFGKTCLPKNILLSQNSLRAMINITSAIFCSKGNKFYRLYLASSSSWWRNNLVRPPYLLYGRRPCWYNLHLLFHRLLLAHPLQPSLLSVRQAWGTPPRL